jgi:hypothetical protein
VLLAAVAAAVLAGCQGHTTGATDIKRQPDGTFSAKLNVVGTCEHGSPTTPCIAYTQWRKVGTTAWSKGPTVTVKKTVTDQPGSQVATGLANNTTYEYQLCGKEFVDKNTGCIGPNKDEATDQFDIGSGSASAGGGSSPAVPILIGVAVAALLVGGGWWGWRRSAADGDQAGREP